MYVRTPKIPRGVRTVPAPDWRPYTGGVLATNRYNRWRRYIESGGKEAINTQRN